MILDPAWPSSMQILSLKTSYDTEKMSGNLGGPGPLRIRCVDYQASRVVRARQSAAFVCGFGERFASRVRMRTGALPYYILRRCATLKDFQSREQHLDLVKKCISVNATAYLYFHNTNLFTPFKRPGR